MLKFYLFLVVSVSIPIVTSIPGLMLGPGRWLVLNIVNCDNPDQYDTRFDINRKKINRTHDGFDLSVDLPRVFNTSYAMKIDVCKEVDGGCKYFQTIEDDCACTFIKKHAEENVKRALTLANIDPTDCPLQPGPIRIKNFVMDYRELPKHGVYGTFEASVYFLLQEEETSCLKVILNFDEENNKSDEDDDDIDKIF